MKLLTQPLEARFKELGTQEDSEDAIVVAKFFNPSGSGTWYAISYDPEYKICFGYVTGLGYDEFGYFSITEMEEMTLPFGLTIERDLYFKECPISAITDGKVY